MPTYDQLKAEPWWDREIVTPEFAWLHAQLAAALGIPRVNVGAKGDNLHLNGSHRSQEWILNSRWCTNRTYTVQAGLTGEQARHLAGCDVTPRSREQMLAICRNLDKATRAGVLEEVLAWYGNTNNDTRVDGYNNVANRIASSDASHLWHLHMTLDRRVLRDMGVMRRILAALLGAETEEDELATAAEIIEWELRPWTINLTKIAERLEVGMAAEVARDAALKTAFDGLVEAVRAGGGSIDAAAIISRIDEIAAAESGKVAELQAELAELRGQLAERDRRLAEALSGDAPPAQ